MALVGEEVAQDLHVTFSPRTALPFHRYIPILMHPVCSISSICALLTSVWPPKGGEPGMGWDHMISIFNVGRRS